MTTPTAENVDQILADLKLHLKTLDEVLKLGLDAPLDDTTIKKIKELMVYVDLQLT